MDVREGYTALLLWTTCYFLAQTRSTWSQQLTTHDTPEDVSPYLLFTTYFGVHRMRINGSTVEDLVVGSYGYSALDYHYEKDLLFWINEIFHCIEQARLSDGSAVTVIIDDVTSDPVDLTVDWINDQLYWLDAGQTEIWEYDMNSNTTRYVMSTGTAETSLPRGIVIYPYRNNGWLYWTEQTGQALMMGSVHGGTKETLMDGLPCLHSLTIDYSTHILYWADECEYTFQSLSLGGNRETHTDMFTMIVYFVSSVARFGDDLYWVQPNGIFTIKYTGDGYQVLMEAPSSARPYSVQVIHPSQQPAYEKYIEIIMDTGGEEYDCTPPCTPGKSTCIPPGLCACEKGWMGPTCSEDIDECAKGTDGCEHMCINYEGGYNCTCYSGYALNNDLKTCSDIDECEKGTDGCEHMCINYEGGYNCTCYSGYALNATNLKSCNRIFPLSRMTPTTTAGPTFPSNLPHTTDYRTSSVFPTTASTSAISTPLMHTHSPEALTGIGTMTLTPTATLASLKYPLKTSKSFVHSVLMSATARVQPSFTTVHSTVKSNQSSIQTLSVTSTVKSTSQSLQSFIAPTTQVGTMLPTTDYRTPSVFPTTASTSAPLIHTHSPEALTDIGTMTLTSTAMLVSLKYPLKTSSFVHSVLMSTTARVQPSFTTVHPTVKSNQSSIQALSVASTFKSTSISTQSLQSYIASTIQVGTTSTSLAQDSTASTTALLTRVPHSSTHPHTTISSSPVSSAILSSVLSSILSSTTPTGSFTVIPSLITPLHTAIAASITGSTKISFTPTRNPSEGNISSVADAPSFTPTLSRKSGTEARSSVPLTVSEGHTATAFLSSVSVTHTTSKNMGTRATSFTRPAVPSPSETLSNTVASVHQPTSTLDLSAVATPKDIQWYKEYTVVISVTAVGVVPALIALLVLLVVLMKRCRNKSGSWSPNNDFGDQPHVDTIQNAHVSMSSFRSLNDGPE